MALIVLPYTFSPSTVISSSQMNASLTAIVGQVNGNLDSTNISSLNANLVNTGSFKTGTYNFPGGITAGSGALPAGLKMHIFNEVAAVYTAPICGGNGGYACHYITITISGGIFSGAPLAGFAGATFSFLAASSVNPGVLTFNNSSSTATTLVFNVDYGGSAPTSILVSGAVFGPA